MSERFKNTRFALSALALILGLGALTPAAYAASQSVYVDGTAGANNVSCGSSTGASACKTIQYAIDNQASNGDTIYVAAGTYNEKLTINKPLTLKGAQAGNDATSWSGAKTIVSTPAGETRTVIVNASNVTIDGLEFDGSTGSDPFAIFVNNNISQNLHVTNSQFVNNKNGIKLYNSDATGFMATHNLFKDNTPDGLYVAGATSQGSDITIANNKFANNGQYGIFIRGGTGTPLSDITISNNSSDGGDYFIDVYQAKNVTIKGNTAKNNTEAIVRVGHGASGGGVNGLTMNGNTFSGSKVGISFDSSTPSSNITVNDNTITGMSTAAMVFESGSISGDVEVTNNTIKNNTTGVQNNSGVQITASNNNADPSATNSGTKTPSGVKAPSSIDTGVDYQPDSGLSAIAVAAIILAASGLAIAISAKFVKTK